MPRFLCCFLVVSVTQVRHPGSESETSDVEGRYSAESNTSVKRKEKKAIGRSASVTNSGSFIATPEWVSVLDKYDSLLNKRFAVFTLLWKPMEKTGSTSKGGCIGSVMGVQTPCHT